MHSTVGKLSQQRSAAVLWIVVLAGACARGADTSETKGVVNVKDVTCQACTIVVDSVVTLESYADTAYGVPLSVRADSLGRYWLVRSGALPALFASNGQFMGTVGSSGQGPGEYLHPSDVIAFARDSVLLIDAGTRRATVLDGALNAIRTIGLPISIANPVALH